MNKNTKTETEKFGAFKNDEQVFFAINFRLIGNKL